MVNSRNFAAAAVVLLGVLGAALLGGCAGTAVPEDEFFRLNVEPPQPVSGAKVLPGTLTVARFQSEGLTSSRAIVYSDEAQPLLLKQYHYHFWVEAPPRFIRQELVSYLRAAGVAERVTAAAVGPTPDYLVDGRVKRFEHVRAKGGAEAVVSIELRFKPGSGSKAALVKEYARSVPVDGRGMHAVASAFNSALAGIFDEFVGDIRP